MEPGGAWPLASNRQRDQSAIVEKNSPPKRTSTDFGPGTPWLVGEWIARGNWSGACHPRGTDALRRACSVEGLQRRRHEAWKACSVEGMKRGRHAASKV